MVRPSDTGTSRVTDLVFGTGIYSGVLYSTTRFDGQIDSWDVSGGGLVAVDDVAFAIGPIAGNQPALVVVDDHLLSEGGTNGALTLTPVSYTHLTLPTIYSV